MSREPCAHARRRGMVEFRHMTKTRCNSALGALGAVALLALGCAGDEQATTARRGPLSDDARWEAVALPDATRASAGDMTGAWWEYRRDDAAGVRGNAPMLAVNDWPEPARDSLRNPRYITLPQRPDTIIRFDPDWGWYWR